MKVSLIGKKSEGLSGVSPITSTFDAPKPSIVLVKVEKSSAITDGEGNLPLFLTNHKKASKS